MNIIYTNSIRSIKITLRAFLVISGSQLIFLLACSSQLASKKDINEENQKVSNSLISLEDENKVTQNDVTNNVIYSPPSQIPATGNSKKRLYAIGLKSGQIFFFSNVIGSNSTGNGTKENPYKTIEYVIDVVNPEGMLLSEKGKFRRFSNLHKKGEISRLNKDEKKLERDLQNALKKIDKLIFTQPGEQIEYNKIFENISTMKNKLAELKNQKDILNDQIEANNKIIDEIKKEMEKSG